MTARPRRISVFDATLGDGEQAPGNAMSPEQKLEIALRLENMGVDVIEVGFPASSPVDFHAARLIAKSVTKCRIATYNRTCADDIRTSMRAIGARPNHQLQICAVASDPHLRHQRGITRAEAIMEVAHSMRLAVSLGAQDISFGVVDACRGASGFIHELIDTALEAGARTIVLSAHCHDDLGLALANSVAGILEGADEVHVTLGGIGERAGNTPLEELAALLTSKTDSLAATTGLRTEQIYEAYRRLAGFIGLPDTRNKAVVGRNAFATQAGVHQAGVLRSPETYTHLDPARFGRKRELMVGRHSGRAVLRHVLFQLGARADEAIVNRLYEQQIANRHRAVDPLDVLRERVRAAMAAA